MEAFALGFYLVCVSTGWNTVRAYARADDSRKRSSGKLVLLLPLMSVRGNKRESGIERGSFTAG